MKKIVFLLFLIPPPVFAAHEQRWIPDTCDCVIIENYDAGVFSFVRFEKKCAAYEGLSDEDAYNTILNENRFKNQTYDYILKNYPDAKQIITAPDGTQTETVKNFQFGYDPDRNLVIQADGLTDIDYQAISIDTGVKSIDQTLKNGIPVSK